MTSIYRQKIGQKINFGKVKGKEIIANFSGGKITSDAGIVLMSELDKKLKITEMFAECFEDYRNLSYENYKEYCLSKTSFAKATVGTIRLYFLKLGARITVSVRRILIAIASSCPYQDILALAYSRIKAIPDTG